MDGLGGPLESDKIGRLVPVYSLTEGVGADLVRKAVMAALPAAAQIADPLPKGLRSRYGLMDLPSAIAGIHFPNDRQQLQDARHRLVFDEFFYLQLGLLCRRQSQKQTQTKAIATSEEGKLIEQFYQLLPFEMTGAQKRVINEILTDIQKTTPMNRLVQGDVGSGKTVVAVVAMLAAIQSGYQAALMAPTEVLAEQHYQKLVNWLTLLNLPVELLTGSTKAAKRKPIYQQLATGELPVVVGTHALIQNTVEFHRLGLVAIDEQHRFGVEQRAKLQQKGVAGAPHVLTMTATPIPRTLALTLHGDLDVSQIDELPPGRTPVQTTVLKAKERKQAHDLIRREVVQGQQAYVVLPLVEESEKLDLRSAIEEYQKLRETVFPEFSVGLLHGRMASAEKEEAIANFRDGKTQILVSTTVIEVGVDVPNATVMLVENAERFGLSQLHQLRGRVGRGGAASYCLLVMNAKATPEAQERLQVLAKSQDGFFIAEMDMRLRGPGEVMGTRQSGMPDFVLASLVEDQDVLMVAREAAERVLAKDPTLNRWPQLQAALEERYWKLMGGAIWT
jgi:ATP-dependent DNA helicase RecG